MKTPLDGVFVLCLAELYPGPYAASLMADMGAEVVQIERPGGDRGRAIPDFFASFARGRRSIVLDLKKPESVEKLVPLVQRADVVIEGFSPGTAKRLGVDHESLSKINPRLIYASITGFGQTGQYRDRPAHDLSYQAIAGLLVGRDPGDEARPSMAAGDVSSALFSVIGILAALQGRTTTGLGTYIDVSVTDCLVSCMAPALVPVLNGRPPLNVDVAPANGLFMTSDARVLSLSVLQEDDFWRQLCDMLDLPEYLNLGFGKRAAQCEAVRARIAARLLTRPLAHWRDELERRRIAWSPVLDLGEVATDPHFAERGLFVRVVNDEGEVTTVVRQPLKFLSYTEATIGPIPTLGEGNQEFLGSPNST